MRFYTFYTYFLRKKAQNRSDGAIRVYVGKEQIMVVLDRIALALVIIGALNWGSIGLFGFDAVAWLGGSQMAIFSRIVYTVVALAGIWCISMLFRPAEETLVSRD